jgi:hypothetical protein
MPLPGQVDPVMTSREADEFMARIIQDLTMNQYYDGLFLHDYCRGVFLSERLHQLTRRKVCLLLFLFARKKGPRNLYVGHVTNPFLSFWKGHFLDFHHGKLKDRHAPVTLLDKQMCLLLNYFYCYGQCMLLNQ